MGAIFGVEVPGRAGHSEASEAQLRKGELGEEALRHRLRAFQLTHWKHRPTTYRELRCLGAFDEHARLVVANARWWRHNSAMRLNRALPLAYFDRLGVPRFS